MDTIFISFYFNNKMQKAAVLIKQLQAETEYDVRPADPSIVRKFGRQIRIFKAQNIFNTHNHISTDYKEFFNCLVRAIRDQDNEVFIA